MMEFGSLAVKPAYRERERRKAREAEKKGETAGFWCFGEGRREAGQVICGF